ncbi:response regulator transcription factor [Geodermatophilus obscurus]|uniref:Two component transcriptional regulator, winged helix family n=1 Tax=Geodermatophilus obscurus (strain ATCC 25078 / DSM 43160 / JCM 3152 / CCUG 61914 / KCC A-0152 / KCTC 9177 / NBRC 13315 / NRRL B-3577 / G-20) TaxID=526225 RepID=D2SH34_GEOOG|nr:response regulator transcription factor [Geodermatophilus obscurus]ADB75027.1 two component transcriptional regulator, winged helix family [Geodermatophilus obscurus DSM 43160]
MGSPGGVARSVLIIEDDDRIRRVVSITLRREGLEVTEAGSGEEGLARLAERPYDIVLLDLVLPGRSGLEVCREIRRVSTTPVIMVTARADSSDVIAGLEAGADDYVTKPFVAEELSARIRALARRTGGSGPRPRIVVGDLEIAPADGVVTRGGEVVPLTRTEFTLLLELATERGRVFSREELLERVWGYDYFGDSRLVDVHVRRLRKKVEADPAAPTVVTTVRGMGYRLPE